MKKKVLNVLMSVFVALLVSCQGTKPATEAPPEVIEQGQALDIFLNQLWLEYQHPDSTDLMVFPSDHYIGY